MIWIYGCLLMGDNGVWFVSEVYLWKTKCGSRRNTKGCI